MRTFGNLFSAEWLKMSRSYLWLLIGVSPVLSAVIGVMVHGEKGVEPWAMLLSALSKTHGMIFLPIMAGLFSAFVCRYEHTGGGWKALLVLPVSRTSVYLSKFIIVAGLLAVCQLIFLIGVLAAAQIQDISGPVPWTMIAISLFGGWAACLPIAALQLSVSLGWASFAAPLAVNVALTIPNILIVNSARFGPFYPWVQPVLAMMPSDEKTFGAFNLPFESLMITVLGSFIVFFASGLLYFNKKEI